MADRQKKYFFLNIILIFLVLNVYLNFYQTKKNTTIILKQNQNLTRPLNFKSNFLSQNKFTTNAAPVTQFNLSVEISLFNLSKPLEPNSTYSTIQCVKSANIYVSTSLCLHRLNMDVHVSGSIWRDGVWEPHLLQSFMDLVKNNPEWLVIDIGAHIGQYSLFSAKLGRKVVCIEPFLDNIFRIHKAAYLEKLWDKIILINNAVSNKRHEIKRLSPSFGNIGGQSLKENENKVFPKSFLSTDKYMVQTILLDDIVDYLPKKNDGSEFKQAIMKIDIEGFEPHAFQQADNLFKKLDIRIVYMEWGKLSEQKNDLDLVEKMIEFFKINNYEAHANNLRLNFDNWKTWPWDVIWKKK